MNGSKITQLYDEIYRALCRDNLVMSLMGLQEADNITKALQVQKRRQPMHIAENLPLISFYTPGGAAETKNSFVFNSAFVFDVYTKDDVELAQDIASAIIDLFDGQINPFTGIENFETVLEDQFESLTNLQNCYCFTTILIFSVSLDK